MRNPLILILAALGTGALASVYRDQRQQLEELKREATETTRIAQRLQQQLIDERRRADDIDAEWRHTLNKLGRSRGEVARLHSNNQQLLAALAQRVVTEENTPAAGGDADTWVCGADWQWPTGPMPREQAHAYAERAATRTPGKCVQLLACVESVQAPEPEPEWDYAPPGA